MHSHHDAKTPLRTIISKRANFANNLYLDPEVVKEAKELGLNLSKVCENV